MKPRQPAARRWYRCTYLHDEGDYLYTTRACALEHFREEARQMTPDSSHWRLGYLKVRAVKVPPTTWLVKERQNALDQADGLRDHAAFLASEMLRSYLPHRKGAQ